MPRTHDRAASPSVRASFRLNRRAQALNRTAPILPLRPRTAGEGHPRLQAQRHHHPAALEVATGKVTDQCYDRHGKAEFLDILKKIAKSYPRRELHVVLDNYHTHKHDDINRWLVTNPRVILHFTPPAAPG
jgi:hypothetical protein